MEDSIRNITERIQAFSRARDWKQFHNPKDMAISISIEAAELLQEFQWKDADGIQRHLEEKKGRVESEMADIGAYLFQLADYLGVDLLAAMHAKFDESEKKYPVEKARGTATKYTEL